jgi:hypothetical protein
MNELEITLNPNLAAQLAASAVVYTKTMEMAQAVAEAAKENADLEGVVDTGAYRDGIKAVQGTHGWARVVASDPKSSWIEFGAPGHEAWGDGSAPLPAHWILRTAAEQLGFKFTKEGH